MPTESSLREALAAATNELAAIRRNEQRMIEAQRISGVGSYDFEIATNTNTWSDQLYRLYGREPQSFNASYEIFLSMLHPDDREHVLAVHQQSMETLEPFQMQERIVWPNGVVRTLASWGEVISDENGTPTRMVGICWDITEQSELQQALEDGLFRDRLTGLANRSLLEDRLSLALSAMERTGNSLGVIAIGVDRFTVINDSLGHEAGDAVLVEVGRRLRSAVRPGDTVARLGGDEFAIVCANLNHPSEAQALAQHLQAEAGKPLTLAGNELVLTVSAGIAVAREAGHSPGELLRDADVAMARAKRSGRARSMVFIDAMHAEARERLELENSLRRALTQEQLRVHYQPIVDLLTGQVSSVEALVRWEHPDRGLLLPGEFLGIAEETGLIVPLGEWVLEHACRQLIAWQSTLPGLRMSVNVAGQQLAEPDALVRLTEVLDRTGVDPHLLTLEITENELMRDPEEIQLVLDGLRQLGLSLHVDDFGTGHSSLTRLKRFPVDALKVDRSFVAGLPLDTGDLAIVQAIVTLAGGLGLETIAEGVETPEQVTALRSLGLGKVQGFLLGRPVPAQEMDKSLLTRIPVPQRAQDDEPVRPVSSGHLVHGQ